MSYNDTINKYIYKTDNFHSGKINIFEAKTNTRIVLDNIDKDNYIKVFSNILKSKFSVKNLEDITFKLYFKIRKLNEIKYEDFGYSQGIIIYILDPNKFF